VLACNFIVKENCTQATTVVMHPSYIIFIAFHHVKHAFVLLRVVTESEEATVNQVPKEEKPPVEVGFDICGSSEDPNYSTNQGKPQCMQTLFLVFYKSYYTLSYYNLCITLLGFGVIINCCMPPLILQYLSLSPLQSL
jgi:hypothetical protein